MLPKQTTRFRSRNLTNKTRQNRLSSPHGLRRLVSTPQNAKPNSTTNIWILNTHRRNRKITTQSKRTQNKRRSTKRNQTTTPTPNHTKIPRKNKSHRSLKIITNPRSHFLKKRQTTIHHILRRRPNHLHRFRRD